MLSPFLLRTIELLARVRLVAIGILLLCASESQAQECTLPSRIFLPTADDALSEQLGAAVDVDGNYMVAGMQENSAQQVYAGRVIVYKFGTDNQWAEVAQLTPSDPMKYLNFGSRVAIHGNSIVVMGREFNDEGISREKLYIFEKASGAEWSSSDETYVIAKPFGTPLAWHRFGNFDIRNNELVAIAYNGSQSFLEIYKKSAGVFSLAQSINTPANSPSFSSYEWNLAVGDNIIALATEQFHQPDNSNGGAFIYTKTAGTYATSPSVLRAAEQTSSMWKGFGVAVAISNNTVFVQGIHESGGLYNQSYYVFEKPPGGWTDAAAPFLLQSPGYVQSNAQLVANENYLFSADLDFRNIVGFKKPSGGWSAAASRYMFSDNTISDKALLGRQLKLDGNHLIAGCPNRFSYMLGGRELIVDYYAPSGTWETPDLAKEEITQAPDINATDDFFGEAFAVYNDRLAIAADGDDERGLNAGVVYVFDAKGSRVEPDQKIYNPEQENHTGFGNSLALGDSVMFVGAPYKDSLNVNGTVALYSIGKVYIYRLTASGWTYSSQIKAPNISAQISFGRRVVWSKGYCAVTEFYSGSSESIGRVHIYKEDPVSKKFLYIATLDPAVHLRSDFFGNSMVMTDSLMVIGTGNIAPNASYRHSAYIFKKKGEWKNATEDARLYATDSGWGDRFGASVSMYGKFIVVGAPYSPGYDPRPIPRPYPITGAAYIFKQPPAGWKGELTQIAKLLPSDPMELGTFGTTVAIDHNDIFIGSPNKYAQYNVADNFTNNDNTLVPGKVYHYLKPAGIDWVSTSQEVRQLESFEPDIIDGYGSAMFVSDRYLFVGSMLDDTQSGLRSGSVQTMMQLPAIDDPPPIVCQDDSPFKLLGFPKNGTWRGPGVHPTTGMFNPSAAGVGIHTIAYERTGCETTVQIQIQSSEVLVTQQSQAMQVKCIDDSVPIIFETNWTAENYRWYFKETSSGQFLKIDSMKQAIVTANPGYYQVTIKRGVCPDYIESFRVMDENPVSISIDAVPPLCDDNPWQLAASPEAGQWAGDGLTGSGLLNTAALEDGNYKALYEVVTPIGCHWKDSVMVKVDKLKQPAIEYNGEEICGGSPVILTAINVDDRSTLAWYGPEGNKLSGEKSRTLTVDEPGPYVAEVSKSFCTQTTLPVEVSAVADSLFVPNVFTPNDDSKNDYFEVRSYGVERFSLSIINRYGRMIFETDELTFRWAGENAVSGIYYWNVEYTTCWNKRKSKKGWVQMIK